MEETLGARLRRTRVRQHRWAKDVAAMAGITAANLSQIEHERVEPRAFTLRCLAQVLAVSTDYLLGLRDTP